MRPLTERLRAKRLVALALAFAALSVLAGCAPQPTTFPAPLTDAKCWEPTGVYSDVPVSSPSASSYWDWDGESETALYYSLYNRSSTEEPAFYYGVYTYRRLCELPESSEPYIPPTPIPVCNVNDGSMNTYHCGRPVAMYAGSLAVWGIDPWTGEGKVAFELTDEQLEAAGIPEDEPVLIAEGINPYTEAAILVYRLPTGEFQLNTWYVGGKPYVVTWDPGESTITALEW